MLFFSVPVVQTQVAPVKVDISERFAVVDGENAEESLAGPHVLVAHGAVLLLPRRVQDVQQTRLPIDHNLLPVRVLRSTQVRIRAEKSIAPLHFASGVIKEK